MAYNGRPDRAKKADGAKTARRGEVYTARDAALRALEEVMTKDAYASQAIDRALTYRELSAEDRRLATGIFYSAVENRMKIEFILSQFVHSAPDPLVNDILHIACTQLLFLDRVPDHAAVDEAVKQAFRFSGRQITGFVNGVLRSVIRARDEGRLPVIDRSDQKGYLRSEYSVSEDLAEVLIAAFGFEEAERICACRDRNSVQTVRPNLMTSSDAELESLLEANKIAFQKGRVPHVYNCSRAGALTSLEAYRKGAFSIQGESAMLAAYATEANIGMNVLARPSLYDAWHDVEILRNGKSIAGSETEVITVAGNICESGDVIARDRKLPVAQDGDLICVLDAGAYGYSMAYTYNTRPRPAEVMITTDGKIRLIRRRETFEDMCALLCDELEK